MRPPPFTLVSCVTEPRRSVRARGIADTNRRVTANSDKSYRIRRTRYVRSIVFSISVRRGAVQRSLENTVLGKRVGRQVRSGRIILYRLSPQSPRLRSRPGPPAPQCPPQARRHARNATQPSPAHAHPWCSRAFGSSPSDGALVPSVQAHKRPDAGTEVAQIVAWTQPSTH